MRRTKNNKKQIGQGAIMDIQQEQKLFQKKIEKNFISLFDLVHKIAEKENLSLNNSSLYLLPRINNYLISENPHNFAYKLEEPPFKKYYLDELSHYEVQYEVIGRLTFVAKNGYFRSEKKAKKIGLLIEAIEHILRVDFIQKAPAQEEPIQETRDYNPTERTTHLQMIAMLAEELAKAKGGKYLKSSGQPNNLELAKLLDSLSTEIEIENHLHVGFCLL